MFYALESKKNHHSFFNLFGESTWLHIRIERVMNALISLYSQYAVKLWLNCQRISEVKQSKLKCVLRGKSVGFASVSEIVMAVVLCE